MSIYGDMITTARIIPLNKIVAVKRVDITLDGTTIRVESTNGCVYETSPVNVIVCHEPRDDMEG